MKYILIYVRFHLTSLLKNRFYYVFIFLSYFYLAFYNSFLLRKTGSILVNLDTPLEYKFIGQQYSVCFILIIMVSMVIYENFFGIYGNFFSIYIRKPATFFHSMVGITIISNVIPYLLGEIVFLIYNYTQTGYWAFHWETSLIVVFEIAILIIFGIALYLLLQKAVLVIGTYFIALYVTSSNNNIYLSIPLYASVMRGHFNPFTLDMWIGRLLLLVLALGLYLLSLKRFLSKKQ